MMSVQHHSDMCFLDRYQPAFNGGFPLFQSPAGKTEDSTGFRSIKDDYWLQTPPLWKSCVWNSSLTSLKHSSKLHDHFKRPHWAVTITTNNKMAKCVKSPNHVSRPHVFFLVFFILTQEVLKQILLKSSFRHFYNFCSALNVFHRLYVLSHWHAERFASFPFVLFLLCVSQVAEWSPTGRGALRDEFAASHSDTAAPRYELSYTERCNKQRKGLQSFRPKSAHTSVRSDVKEHISIWYLRELGRHDGKFKAFIDMWLTVTQRSSELVG